MQPAPQIPDSLIVLTIGQSHLASLNYNRIIVILDFSFDLWQSVLSSSSLFYSIKDNAHFILLCKPIKCLAPSALIKVNFICLLSTAWGLRYKN